MRRGVLVAAALAAAGCAGRAERVKLFYSPVGSPRPGYSTSAVALLPVKDARKDPASLGAVDLESPLGGWVQAAFADEALAAGLRVHGRLDSLQPGDLVLELTVQEAACKGVVRSRCDLRVGARLERNGVEVFDRDYSAVGRAWNIEGGGPWMFKVGMERALQRVLGDLLGDFPGS